MSDPSEVFHNVIYYLSKLAMNDPSGEKVIVYSYLL